jgi:hypothetical protein
MDVGDKRGVDDVKLFVVEALDGRKGLVHQVVDCLLLAGFSHTTFWMPNITRQARLGLSKFRIQVGLSNLVSGPKTRHKTS